MLERSTLLLGIRPFMGDTKANLKGRYHEVMDSLKGEVRSILRLIPEGSRIAYLDYPVHKNIGDMIITAGTEKFIEDHRLDVIYRASVRNFPTNDEKALARIPDEDIVILCHGGGNFGDLYPHFQTFRERIARLFPSNRIIILPQTIYFQDEKNLIRAASAFARHPDLHIFVRDEKSYSTATKYLSNHVYMAPDMAHQLWPLAYPGLRTEEAEDTLFLIRRDIEGGLIPAGYTLFEDNFVDWWDLIKPHDRLILYLIYCLYRADRVIEDKGPVDGFLNRYAEVLARRFWFRYAEVLMRKAVRLFAPHRQIVTSRLHGHILACLMAKHHVVLDNSYGKNSAYWRAWTHRLAPHCSLYDSI